MATLADNLILACWIALVLYWVISARRVKPILEQQSLPVALTHRLPLGLGWWLLAYPELPPP